LTKARRHPISCWFDGSGENRGHFAIWETVTLKNRRGKALRQRETQMTIGGDHKTFAIPVNTGKPGSLKKNYGSWKVARKLRHITPIDKK
jgi:hypothetical protein